jgi:hypothetical protein
MGENFCCQHGDPFAVENEIADEAGLDDVHWLEGFVLVTSGGQLSSTEWGVPPGGGGHGLWRDSFEETWLTDYVGGDKISRGAGNDRLGMGRITIR